jgi:rhamnose transport system ATP-binding protein
MHISSQAGSAWWAWVERESIVVADLERAPSPGEGTVTAVLELRDIAKHFDGVVAVDGVSFDVRAGEVHALVGENGAGKSTLVKVAVGYHQLDQGEIRIDGERRALASTHDAELAGIAMIPQELDQFLDLSVAENLYVGRRRPRTRWGGIDRASMAVTANEVLARLGVRLDVRSTMRQLSVAQRQIVAIARALVDEARIVIMDEPTSALSEREAERLFGIVRELTNDGVGIVYISHRLEEVFAIADRITVLRDGRHIATSAAGDLDAEELVRLMVGRPLSELYTRQRGDAGDAALELRGLSLPGTFEDVDLILRRGEVVGLAGLIGAGRTEVAQAVFGAAPAAAGTIVVDGRDVTVRQPADAMALGIAYVPEERQSQGLVLDFSIARNISLSSLRALVRYGLVDRRKERALAERFATTLTIRGAPLDAPVSRLSGGNQQKVVVSKVLAREPDIILLDEPTRGIDVGAKSEIYELIDELAAAGKAVLMISSELLEVLALSDRVVVMREGRVVGELGHRDATQERVMTLATGVAATATPAPDPTDGRIRSLEDQP